MSCTSVRYRVWYTVAAMPARSRSSWLGDAVVAMRWRHPHRAHGTVAGLEVAVDALAQVAAAGRPALALAVGLTLWGHRSGAAPGSAGSTSGVGVLVGRVCVLAYTVEKAKHLPDHGALSAGTHATLASALRVVRATARWVDVVVQAVDALGGVVQVASLPEAVATLAMELDVTLGTLPGTEPSSEAEPWRLPGALLTDAHTHLAALLRTHARGAVLSRYALTQHRQYLAALELVLRYPKLVPTRPMALADLTTQPLGVVLEAPTTPAPAPAPASGRASADDAISGSRLSRDAQ